MDRQVKEKIHNCFEEKNACETALKDATSSQFFQRPYLDIILALLAGFAAGVVIDKSVHF